MRGGEKGVWERGEEGEGPGRERGVFGWWEKGYIEHVSVY